MAIDITGANTYFGATIHIRSESWTRISQARRIAAIAHATRLIESRLEDDIETDNTVAGDFPRHDAAVYEQALSMLETIDLATLLGQDAKKAEIANALRSSSAAGTICLHALRFLVIDPRSARLSRG